MSEYKHLSKCRLCLLKKPVSKRQGQIHKGICAREAARVGYSKKLLSDKDVLNSLYSLGERVLAIEAYIKDLKWAIEKLGFDPKKHELPPSAQPDKGEV